MNIGKTLFAQVMEFVPWKTFGRIIEQYRGDAGIRTLTCTEVFRIMAFSQLTWRESLRDIEACLSTHHQKLFQMGIKTTPARSTLADALNNRDWRIYHELAMRLISRARKLYSEEVLDVGLEMIAVNGVYASKDYPENLRKVRFKDPVTKKNLVFLTNNTALLPLVIATLYKNRWQVELFFKWIKQNLKTPFH